MLMDSKPSLLYSYKLHRLWTPIPYFLNMLSPHVFKTFGFSDFKTFWGRGWGGGFWTLKT